MRITTMKALLAVFLGAGVSLLLSGNRLEQIVWAGGGHGGMDMGGSHRRDSTSGYRHDASGHTDRNLLPESGCHPSPRVVLRHNVIT